MRQIKAFFKSKILWLNLLIAVLVFLGLFWGIFKWLDWMTHHGESVTVPDLEGMTLTEVEDYLEDKQLRFRIMDSTYNPELKPLEIYSQNPKAGSKVKENRNIYIAINAKRPPQNKVPNVERKSYKSAIERLSNEGFKVGKIIYKPDRFENSVIELQIDGKKIDPFTELPEGTQIDIVLGSGLGDPEVPVPDLTGMKLSEATFKLQGYDLNIGYTSYDPTIRSREDTLNAVIYRQVPPPDTEEKMRWGEAIDVHLMKKEDYEALQDTNRPVIPLDSFPGDAPPG